MSDQTLGLPADPTLVAEMVGVREHGEGLPVWLRYFEENGRLVVVASNEGGYNHTYIDLLDLLQWLKRGPLNEGIVIADVDESHP